MRKKLLTIFLSLFAFAAIFFVSGKKANAANSANGYRVEEVFSDKFNREALDPSWTLNDAELVHQYSALHCISPVSYGSGPVINAAHLADKTVINFTIYPQSGKSDSNISFMIGVSTPTEDIKEPNADCKVMLWNDQVVYGGWQTSLEVNQSKIDQHVLRGFNSLYSSLLRTDVAIVLTRVSPTLTEIYVEYSRDGEVIYSTKDQAFELEDPRNPYGYFGFFWDAVEMDVTNFYVYNDDELVYEDDLTENTLTYPSTDYTKGNIHICSVLNESNVFISRIQSVVMDAANESIANSHILVKLDNVTNPYTIDYSIKVNELKENSFFGFGVGMPDTTSKIDANNAIGFIKKNALTAEVVLVRDGEVDRSNNYTIALTKLANGKYNDMQVSFDSSNNAYLTVAGATYAFANVDFYGAVGVGLVDLGAEESSSAEMNVFSLKRNAYSKRDAEDLSNDFSGYKQPDDPLDDPAPYINLQKYYLGTNVKFEEDWTTGEPQLTFSNSNPYSCFSVCKEYSEFILEFDIDVIGHSLGSYFGISFGRKSIVDLLQTSSTSNNAFLFRNDGGATGMTTWGAGCKFDDGSTGMTSPMNFYNPTKTKYHFMFVAKNRSLYVYFKEASAPITDLSILRAQVNNINIEGFVSIVGSNGGSFIIDNYKIVNLSDDCTKESELTLRELFNGTDVSDKIELYPGAEIVDNKLVIADSSVVTTSEKLYGTIRFTAYDIEDNFQILFSGNRKIIFRSSNGTIEIKEGVNSTVYDCEEMNLEYIKGKRFEITFQGDTVTIGYKGHYDPLDKMSVTLVTHKFSNPFTKDYITFLSNGTTTIDDLYLFSLDNSMEAIGHDYEDDPDNAQIWVVKPDFDPSKVYDPSKEEGCKSAIGSISLIFAVLGIIPVIALKKKEEER